MVTALAPGPTDGRRGDGVEGRHRYRGAVVNVLGHTEVALATGCDDPAFLLGAVLPDLAPMAGVRVDRARLAGRLADGLRCHLWADAAFHAHPAFRTGSGALRRELAARGIGSGAARAIGHAGWELLLDGALVATRAEAGFRHALAAAGDGCDLAAALVPDDRLRWKTFLAHGRRQARLRYDDPAWIAERLYATLAHRPRLRLRADHVATVAVVLADHAEDVRGLAVQVLADTTRAGRG
jgi:hypothetical protein